MLDMQKLIYFVSVVKHGSFTKAAEQHFVSQPTITKAVKHLESQYGTQLLVRDSNTVFVTEAGRILYGYVQPLLANLENSQIEIEERIKETVCNFRLGFAPVSGNDLLPLVYGKYHELYPDRKITLLEGGSFELIDKLQKHELDLCYIIEEVLDKQLKDELFFKRATTGYIMVLVNSKHQLAQLDSVDLGQLERFPYFGYPQTTFVQKYIDAMCTRKNVQLNRQQNFSQIALVLSMVVSNFGFAFIMNDSIPLIRNHPDLKVIRLRDAIHYHTCFIGRKKEYIKQGAKEFMNFIVDEFQSTQTNME